jgi:hypothetical protein
MALPNDVADLPGNMARPAPFSEGFSTSEESDIAGGEGSGTGPYPLLDSMVLALGVASC